MSELEQQVPEEPKPVGSVDAQGETTAEASDASKEKDAPIDTVSGVTKELFEARSAETPEAKKRESITGIIAIIIALIVLALFAFGSKLGLGS